MDGHTIIWTDVGHIDDIPRLRSRVVSTPECDIAVFRTGDDQVFARTSLLRSCDAKGATAPESKRENQVREIEEIEAVNQRPGRSGIGHGVEMGADEQPSRSGFGCRPAPDLAHVSRMARCGDKSPSPPDRPAA